MTHARALLLLFCLMGTNEPSSKDGHAGRAPALPGNFFFRLRGVWGPCQGWPKHNMMPRRAGGHRHGPRVAGQRSGKPNNKGSPSDARARA